MSNSQWKEDAKEISAGMISLYVLGGIVILVGLAWAAMATFSFGLYSKATADFRGDVAMTEKVHADGNFRIAAYDHFFDACAEIQAKEGTIAALKDELAMGPTPERASIVQSTITGVTAARNADISRYNGDAAKTDTMAAFKASSLPFRIDPTQEKTQCTVS